MDVPARPDYVGFTNDTLYHRYACGNCVYVLAGVGSNIWEVLSS